VLSGAVCGAVCGAVRGAVRDAVRVAVCDWRSFVPLQMRPGAPSHNGCESECVL